MDVNTSLKKIQESVVTINKSLNDIRENLTQTLNIPPCSSSGSCQDTFVQLSSLKLGGDFISVSIKLLNTNF